jgi:hypothetical protein
VHDVNLDKLPTPEPLTALYQLRDEFSTGGRRDVEAMMNWMA